MNDDRNDQHWMAIAIETARLGIRAGQTPFGCCIVRGDSPVASAHNVVWLTTDITAHAEVTAIRKACAALATVDLSGCVVYSTCEPCPMCFSAIHWSRAGRIVYGATIADAAAAGFNEMPVSNARLKQLGGSGVELTAGVMAEECRELFRAWARSASAKPY